MASATDPNPAPGPTPDQQMVEELPYRDLRGGLLWVFVVLTLLINVLVLNQLLNLGFFAKITLIENRYLYLLAALTLPLAYLAYSKDGHAQAATPWYDHAAAALSLAAGCYFAWNGERILAQGWEYSAPTIAIVMSGLFWLLVKIGRAHV